MEITSSNTKYSKSLSFNITRYLIKSSFRFHFLNYVYKNVYLHPQSHHHACRFHSRSRIAKILESRECILAFILARGHFFRSNSPSSFTKFEKIGLFRFKSYLTYISQTRRPSRPTDDHRLAWKRTVGSVLRKIPLRTRVTINQVQGAGFEEVVTVTARWRLVAT